MRGGVQNSYNFTPASTLVMRAWWIVPLVAFVPPSVPETSPQDLCVITITPNSAFSQVVVRVDEIYNESRKSSLAQELDDNRDGTVDGGEEAGYENASRMFVEYHKLGEKRLSLDDKAPWRVEFRTELSRVLGPANDTMDWLITEVRTYDFRQEELDAHRIGGGNGSSPEPRAVVEFVVAKAPEGWWVHRVNGTLFDQPEVSLPAFDTRQLFAIDYSNRPGLDYRLPVKGDPGFEAWAAMAGLAAVGVLAGAWRRRNENE